MNNYRYNKDTLKENLSIEEVFNLVNELGGDPIMGNNFFTARTICHGGDSHKLYYYDNSHLFHCYTGCANSTFDIYELILKINKNAGIENFTLNKSIIFVAKYFGYTYETFDYDDNFQLSKDDWKIINDFKKNKENIKQQIVDLKTYDDKILKNLPQPHILPWEKENISYEIIKEKNIRYNPISEGIVIPHYDINDNLIGIRERTLIKENEKHGKYRPAIIKGKMYNHPLGFNLYNLNNSKKNIKRLQKAIIYEGEKSCLKHESYFGKKNDISVACCGSNLTNYQFKLLFNLDVKEIIIAFDKQFQIVNDEEWNKWVIKLKTIHNRFGGYINISYLFDKNNVLKYKNSPIDQSIDDFMYLFKNRIFLE